MGTDRAEFLPLVSRESPVFGTKSAAVCMIAALLCMK